MLDYKEMHFTLFREVTKVIQQLEEIQQKTEEMYMEAEDNLVVFDSRKDK